MAGGGYMLRDFSGSSKQNLLELVSQVESEKICNFTDWIGDRWFDFEEWIGVLNIKKYVDKVNEYHKKVIDKNNTTKRDIEQIFDNVKSVDKTYYIRFKDRRTGLRNLKKQIETMNEIMAQGTGSFNSENISISMEKAVLDGEVEIIKNDIKSEIDGITIYNFGHIESMINTNYQELSEAEQIAIRQIAEEFMSENVLVDDAMKFKNIMTEYFEGTSSEEEQNVWKQFMMETFDAHPLLENETMWKEFQEKYLVRKSSTGAMIYNIPEYARKNVEPASNGIYGPWVYYRDGSCGTVSEWNDPQTKTQLSCTYYTLRKLNERGVSYPCVAGPGDGCNWYANFDTSTELPRYSGNTALYDLANGQLPQENIVVSFESNPSDDPKEKACGHVMLIDRIEKDDNGEVRITYSDNYPHITTLNGSNPPQTKTIEQFMSYYNRLHENINGVVVIGAIN